MNRREFLRCSLGASALWSMAPVTPRLLAQAAAHPALDPRGDTILVALQLSGGNDGLNCLVPFADDAYARARPTLRRSRKQVLPIDDRLGWHPRLRPLARLFDEGLLAVWQGVGAPGQSRDHAAAMRAWHVADPHPETHFTGWLGRAADRLLTRAPLLTPAAFVGRIPTPFVLNAARALVPAWAEPFNRDATPDGPAADIPVVAETDHPLARHIRAVAARAEADSRRLRAMSRERRPGQDGYPDFALAAELRTVADLIRADLGARIFVVELGGGGIGGFDNHANQAGNHDALLDQLARALEAFARDLRRDGLLDRVLLMTYSEFGRTVKENGRHGTDHGLAGPVFLLGGGVRPGLRGEHPSLTDLDQGGLKATADFRALYAAVLGPWLGLPSREILGARHAPLPLWSA
ncbi:MAG: DUF1501 domain-containing protein [Verrucomicrobia bacterium]|nr:MAG: DUF1501 domain-containing protein [Verrucomicrobiota bacterium]